MKILVIDDEPAITDAMRDVLSTDRHEVRVGHDATEFLNQARVWKPDLVLLDMGLPGSMTGLDAIRVFRRESNVPVIFVTGRAGDIDKALGLEYADDYLVKPFSPVELLARIRAVMRRSAPRPPDEEHTRIVAGDLVLDLEAYQASFAGQSVQLTSTEFKILSVLAGRPGRVFPRDELVERVWGPDAFLTPHTLDVHIASLRRKLESDAPSPAHIETVRAVGFRYAV